MKATIISIGNELLNGKTVNSNATFIGGRLYNLGIVTEQIITVKDDADAIKENIQAALEKSEVLILTGGLGPTHDDITKKAVADFFNSALIFNETILKKVKDKFRRRGLKMPEVNRNQALVPDKAKIFDNPVGTAPGMRFEDNQRYIFVLPGVPKEMQSMIDRSVLPFLGEKFKSGRIDIHNYRTTGIAESKLYELCQDLLERYPGYEAAFLPRFIGVDIRVAAKEAETSDVQDFADFENELYSIIGKYIYAKGDAELEEAIGDILRERRLTIGVAESATGGLIQHKLTNISGSSGYFKGGMVTYSNESKVKFLNVREKSLERHGAVSDVVAREMAAGIRKNFDTDIGLSTTGIAGPTGGTKDKPVGLLYVGLATSEKVLSRKFLLGEDRLINKDRGAQATLDLLRRELMGIETGAE